jgi:transcriptional regulator with XRE-family HTH domain
MTTDERRRPAIGAEVRRWRTERGLTLAAVAERSGLNVGYLSQIENDKASPSLTCLGALSDALDVPTAWFFMGEVPAPRVVRAADRVVRDRDGLGRIELVDGGDSRDLSIVEGVSPVGGRSGLHAHAGDEHHLILRGRWRMSQGDHVVELGPGDYIRWDGTVPHDAEVIGDEEGHVLIVTIHARG